MSDGLSPPPNPHCASSSNLRQAFTLTTLGRRRSSSCLQLSPVPTSAPPIQPHPPATDPVVPASSPSMLVIVVSRFLEWLHVQPKHTLHWSTPSSPRSSTDEFVLPLSASAHPTVFVHEKQFEKSHPSHNWFQGFPSVRNTSCLPRGIIPNVCSPTDSRTNIARYIAFPVINCACPLLLVHITDFRFMASDTGRPGSTRQRASWLFSKWAGPDGACSGCHGYHSGVEACVVNTWKCCLGESSI